MINDECHRFKTPTALPYAHRGAFTDRIESGIKTTVKDKISHPQATYLLCKALKGFDVSFVQGGSGNGTIHYLYYSSTYQLISL